jgi:pilus assembly protein Flp/PilA
MQRTEQSNWLGACVRPNWILSQYARIIALTESLTGECGQDLIEYALVAALIALAATASMSGVAAAISTAFTSIGAHIGTYTS